MQKYAGIIIVCSIHELLMASTAAPKKLETTTERNCSQEVLCVSIVPQKTNEQKAELSKKEVVSEIKTIDAALERTKKQMFFDSINIISLDLHVMVQLVLTIFICLQVQLTVEDLPWFWWESIWQKNNNYDDTSLGDMVMLKLLCDHLSRIGLSWSFQTGLKNNTPDKQKALQAALLDVNVLLSSVIEIKHSADNQKYFLYIQEIAKRFFLPFPKASKSTEASCTDLITIASFNRQLMSLAFVQGLFSKFPLPPTTIHLGESFLIKMEQLDALSLLREKRDFSVSLGNNDQKIAEQILQREQELQKLYGDTYEKDMAFRESPWLFAYCKEVIVSERLANAKRMKVQVHKLLDLLKLTASDHADAASLYSMLLFRILRV